MQKYHLLLLLLVFTLSCKNNTDRKKNTVCKTILVNNETALTAVVADSFLELKNVIKIKMGNFNKPDDLFGEINKVVCINNAFYLADYKSKKIIKVNQDGIVVAILNKPGEGPGEYKGINQMQLQNDSLLLLDAFGKKIFIYDTNFKYLNYISFKNDLIVCDFYCIANKLLSYSNFSDPYMKANLVLYDYSKNKVLQKYLTFNDPKVSSCMNLAFNSENYLTYTNKGIRLLEPLSNTIYNYDIQTSTLDSLFEITFLSNNLPHYFRYQVIYKNTVDQADKQGYNYIRDYYFENDKFLKFQYTNDIIFVYDKNRGLPIANAQRLLCLQQAGLNPSGAWYPYSKDEFITILDGNYLKPAELDKVKDRFKNQEFYHTLRNQAIEGNFFFCIWKLK